MVKPKSVESELIKKIIFGIEDVKGADVNIMDLTNSYRHRLIKITKL